MTDHYETRCPMCGGSDEQGCYADCPSLQPKGHAMTGYRVVCHLYIEELNGKAYILWPDSSVYSGPFKTISAAKRELTLLRKMEARTP